MTVKLADGFIASDQTGAFPRVSNNGNKYICVFYIYDTNFIKSVAISNSSFISRFLYTDFHPKDHLQRSKIYAIPSRILFYIRIAT